MERRSDNVGILHRQMRVVEQHFNGSRDAR
jgi:hypothetical protein